jgi:hypothetical protein
MRVFFCALARMMVGTAVAFYIYAMLRPAIPWQLPSWLLP